MTTYALNDVEKKAVGQLRTSFNETQKVIQQAQEIIETKRRELDRLQGALNGSGWVMLNQQNLLPTGKETFRFDDALENLLVETPEENNKKTGE
jgi:hypothetical protein